MTKIVNGSEKQIAWAEDIQTQNAKKIDFIVDYIENSDEIQDQFRAMIIDAFEAAMSTAKFWIDNRNNFDGHSDNWNMADSCNNGRTRNFVVEVIAPLLG